MLSPRLRSATRRHPLLMAAGFIAAVAAVVTTGMVSVTNAQAATLYRAAKGSVTPTKSIGTQGLPTAFQGPLPVVLSKPVSQQVGTKNRDGMPLGVNYYDPAAAARHPHPVILVYGTYENASSAWIGLAPLLRNLGFNVYTYNFGRLSEDARAGGMDDIRRSAATLAEVVAQVRRDTGAEKVDIVGHSQGGLIPQWYIKKLGGARYTRQMVGIAANLRGSYSTKLAKPLNALVNFPYGPAMEQQAPNSAFLRELYADDAGQPNSMQCSEGLVCPGVHYTMIGSRFDEEVLPHSSMYLPAGPTVTNIVVQDLYPLDFADHFAMPYDPYTLSLVVRALDPALGDELLRSIPQGIVPFWFGGFLPLSF